MTSAVVRSAIACAGFVGSVRRSGRCGPGADGGTAPLYRESRGHFDLARRVEVAELVHSNPFVAHQQLGQRRSGTLRKDGRAVADDAEFIVVTTGHEPRPRLVDSNEGRSVDAMTTNHRFDLTAPTTAGSASSPLRHGQGLRAGCFDRGPSGGEGVADA
jgi:hypothetical protein